MLDEMNILVVEDEAIVALDLSMMLREQGAYITGPCATVDKAVAAVDGTINAALLDVDLRGKEVFPVADALRELGTPFVFHTGRYDITCLTDRYGDDVPVLIKPAGEEAIIEALVLASGRAA